MTYPYFTKGLAKAPSLLAEAIPSLPRSRADSTAAYIPHADLSHAVNVALMLGMPLLLTGEPGTGKTQLAYVLAAELGCEVLRFDAKSSSQARDLFYTFDALSAFKMKDATDLRPHIRYQALGQAILEAFAADAVAGLLVPGAPHAGPRRSVVLIDEIDKAPRDFPNDLLNEIEHLYFRVPELGNLATPGADDAAQGVPPQFRPIVVLTSNSEKGLPDPFLRRCVYFDIPFPTPDEMEAIVAGQIKGMKAGDPLTTDALDLFYALRSTVSLKKAPSTAELLNWLQVLRARGAQPEAPLRPQAQLVDETLSVLVKSGDDRTRARKFIAESWATEPAA
ncbi:AAA family ATPase [Novosphingobium sp.]|uniref:AAA family ATPase n=1 Tax=Novosphingobium sp. TaxID=1874826 RepID=UPI0038B8EEA0